MLFTIFRFGILLIISFSLLACTHAKPWERQYLARPEMSFTPDPLEKKMSEHADQSKEASATVSAGSGGGCGCY